MTKRDTKQLLVAARDADLDVSGLNSPKHIKRLQLTTLLDSVETEALTGLKMAVAYEIPYFDLDGERTQFSRWKLIALDEPLKFKYYQKPKTIPRLYLPPLVDWRKIAADPSQPIVITEGEKKAAAGCVHGMNCIGLGGVWNWKASKWGLDKLPEFDEFAWSSREVEVCFDGDQESKEEVARAREALKEMLAAQGAKLSTRYLPARDDARGLDEFLVKYGAEAYRELPREEAKQSGLLWELNSDLVYIKETQSWWSDADNSMYGRQVDLIKNYGHLMMPATSDRARPEPAIDRWVRWPHRRRVARLTYAPGSPRFHDDAYNLWRGWGCEPKRGSVSVFRDIVAGFGSPEFQVAFWQWLAFPIQNPGAKINWAVVLWSIEQGTGKSFVGDVMTDLYGQANVNVIGTADLYGDDNTWLRHVQLVVGEEITKANDRRAADKLKNHITGERVRINEKYVPRYWLPNRANILLLSNHPDAVYIDDQDRRYCVAEIHNDPADLRLWSAAKKWRESGGAAALFHYLLNDVDCSKFDPKSRAPMTNDKAAMIFEAKTTLERWAADLLEDPDAALGDMAKAVKGRDVFTVEELFQLLPEEIREMKPTLAALSKALLSAGAVRGSANPVKVAGKSKRLLAIRNLSYWREHRDNHDLLRSNYTGKTTVINGRARA